MPDDKLSVVIPAYNEERFIAELVRRVLQVDLKRFGLTLQVIVVDDCSKDRTAEIVRTQFPEIAFRSHAQNQGKGGAVRTGLALATGRYVIIQDADLEYDPQDYIPMLTTLIESGVEAVYGSRYLKHPGRGALVNLLTGKHASQSWPAWVGGQSLSFAALLFTGRYLTDTVTALKLFRHEVIAPLTLTTSGFELDHEITAKVVAHGGRIREVPIRYFPRSKEEGKKIGFRDWVTALRTFARFRRRSGT